MTLSGSHLPLYPPINAEFHLCRQLPLPWVYLAAWMTVKDEGHYIPEWLEYAEMMGVQRVYIYDNNSTDFTSQLLEPYVQSGFVVHINWPFSPTMGMQQAGLNDALWRFGDLSAWMLCIDPDEFPISTDGRTLASRLQEWDHHYVSAVGLVEYKFGTSGHVKRPRGLVLENYVRRLRTCSEFVRSDELEQCPSFRQLRMSKMVVNTRNSHLLYIHFPRIGLSYNRTDVFEPPKYHARFGRRDEVVSYPVLAGFRLHHYKTKSMEDWFVRRVSRLRASGKPPYSNNISQYHDVHYNEVIDHTALTFVPELKRRLYARYLAKPQMSSKVPSIASLFLGL
mmetsp:Transcript_15596/g.26857  ORF Transcript_15596/g.26857 Transcript_15596/m.26857 type:complete len:337 (+) Transcript_15596:692-1702(+)|eukprot:CAMPEP_0196656480 /NCGR_PEP_ID=MMETSP1086-20130531/17405_1 /TAXON_ID=77921 /ORGANISM="Cyanoptyche  gloeocystis , Strain SAG4.97" /LENGTH=336 /DNA_ID=CAMNT_0041989239 /DNA_START=687 /DNA_END=1697 /DNA_ORIENTATION=-